LARVELELKRSGRATVDRWDPPEDRGEFDTNRIRRKDQPNLELFEGWELAYVDTWIKEISKATAKRISELSHDDPGWRLARPKQGVIA
jgi:hypothetical protein